MDAGARRREADALFDALLASVAAMGDRASPRAAATPDLSPQQLHVAAAVVMLHMMRADHEIRPDEQRALGRSLHRVLGLDETTALHVIRLAEEQSARDASFRDVVTLLDRLCPADMKKKIVHCLWRIAYADAELAAHEEYLVRKVSEHLHLETRDLVETKVRAREEFLRD